MTLDEFKRDAKPTISTEQRAKHNEKFIKELGAPTGGGVLYLHKVNIYNNLINYTREFLLHFDTAITKQNISNYINDLMFFNGGYSMYFDLDNYEAVFDDSDIEIDGEFISFGPGYYDMTEKNFVINDLVFKIL